MTATIMLEETKATLKEVVEKLVPGEEIVITRNQQPIASPVGWARPTLTDRLSANRIDDSAQFFEKRNKK